MAKIKAGFRAKRGSTRIVPTRVIVHRTADRGSTAFEACVRVGSNVKKGWHAVECAFGRNPRAAVANAMNRYASALRKRRGAFRGTR